MVDVTAKLAARIETLIGLVTDTQDAVLRLTAIIREPRPQAAAVTFAGQVLHDMRPALATVSLEAETLAAARRAGRREGWLSGFAAGRESRKGPDLRLVRTTAANASRR